MLELYGIYVLKNIQVQEDSMKVSSDTRTIKKGEYFVPVKGANFDGHDFVEMALQKGAVGIIEESELYEIAKKKLSEKSPIVVGVTGSIGKSTFRSFLSQILGNKYQVLEGDLNTQLGLSLKIVNELEDQEIFVAEMGIDRIGEMKTVTDFLKPDFSIITKIGKEHLEFLLSLENVIRENAQSILNSKRKKGYINILDRESFKGIFSSEYEIMYFPGNDIPREVSKTVDNLEIAQHDKAYLLGVYDVVSREFGFSFSQFVSLVGNIQKPKGRLNVLEGRNGCTVIDDSYNAVCDETIIEGIKFAQTMAKRKGKKLHLVISNMRENGQSEEEQHMNVANFLNTVNYDSLFVVGEKPELYTDHLKGEYSVFSSMEEISVSPSSNDLFYVKSSRYYKGEDFVNKVI